MKAFYLKLATRKECLLSLLLLSIALNILTVFLVFHQVGVHVVALESLGIHEDVVGAVEVGVLELQVADVGGLELIVTAVRFVDGVACQQVFHADAVDGLAFAGFAELKVGDDVGFALEFDFDAFFKIAGFVHKFSFFWVN